MIIMSKNTQAQITKHRVAARMEGITLNNLPLSDRYDRKTGIDSGDLPSYQMDHLPIEGQIIAAEHQLNKAKSDIRTWQFKGSANGINMGVGINDQERYGIFKNAPIFIGRQMNAAIKTLENIDPVIGATWRQRNLEFYSTVGQIENLYPSKKGCNKNRLKALAPALVIYLDDINSLIETLLQYYCRNEEYI